MLKCWSHLPKDRPTFDELTKTLWDLEHTGSNYVNLERLLQQSMESEGMENDTSVNILIFLCNLWSLNLV